MGYETILIERGSDADAGIARVTLNRPERANTLSSQLVRDLHAVLDEIKGDQSIRVVVFTGAGRHFCAGADLRETNRDPGWIDSLRSAFRRIETLALPTIASINGAAMGGGCELSISCDLRIISSSAIIGLPEIKFGAMAIAGGTQRLPRLIGMGKAKEMHFIGEPLDAAEAYRVGLVNRVAAPEELREQTMAMARQLAERPPHTLQTVKFLINTGSQMDIAAALDVEARVSATRMGGASFEEDRQRAAERFPVYSKIFSKPD